MSEREEKILLRLPDPPMGLCSDYQADPWGMHSATAGCEGEVVSAPGGGVKCTKCPGWFCF
jgi:hypothetical protein